MDNNAAPNLFIAGAPRCGTTSLYNYLKEHPQVFGPDIKEPRYLAHAEMKIETLGKMFQEMTIVSEVDYLALYKDGATFKYRMDGTPFYMFYPEAIQRMKDISSDSRVIISIRNPVDRIISVYNMMWNRGLTQSGFKENIDRFRENGEIKFNRSGLYSKQIRNLWDILGRDRVHIINFDELKNDINKTLKGIYAFLEIEAIIPENAGTSFYSNKRQLRPGIIRNILTGKFAKNMYLKLPKTLVGKMKRIFNIKSLYSDSEIDDDIKQELLDFYLEDINETEKLTGFDLSSWKSI